MRRLLFLLFFPLTQIHIANYSEVAIVHINVHVNLDNQLAICQYIYLYIGSLLLFLF